MSCVPHAAPGDDGGCRHGQGTLRARIVLDRACHTPHAARPPSPCPPVSALKKSLKPSATVRRDGRFETRDAADLVPGDLVLLGSGSAIPADCIVIEGRIEVDQAALTGESMPVTMDPGHKCMMGSTAMRGEARAMVEKTGSHTYLGKSATMIQSVGGMGSLQKLLLKMMVTLLVAAVVLCFTCFGYLMGIGNSFRKSIEFTVVVLISSIPIALEIVITSTLALGSRQLSRHGAIVTRLAAIEEMAGMNILCSDKTGEGAGVVMTAVCWEGGVCKVGLPGIVWECRQCVL